MRKLLALTLLSFSMAHAGELTLKVGESGWLSPDKYISLLSVDDSRCPPNVECFWEGELKAKVKIVTRENTLNWNLTYPFKGRPHTAWIIGATPNDGSTLKVTFQGN